VTDALATVTEHLEHAEQLLNQWTTASAKIVLGDGTTDNIDIDALRTSMDDAIWMVVTEWEALQRPAELTERIQLLPGWERATIAAQVDPATDAAFADIVQADDWTPTPLDAHGEPPPFPIHTLPDWAQDHAVATADQVQVPVDLTAMLIIGALSAACTGRARVNVSANWAEPINLYLVTAMRSGSGKSAAEKLCCQWLRDWQKARMDDVMDDWNIAMRVLKVAERKVKEVETGMSKGSQTMDDMKFALRELDEAKDNLPDMPRLLADDATPEAVATLLAAHNERLAIMSTEADLFDMVLKGKAGQRANMNVYLKAWSGDSLIRDRKGGSETGPEFTNLEHPLMTVACTVQPSVLARLSTDEEMASRGFSARFMMSLPDDRIGERDQDKRFNDNRIATTDIYTKTATALADDWAMWQPPTQVNLDSLSRDCLRAFLAEIEPQLKAGGKYEHLAEWASKLYGSIARYAGLLHLAEGRSPAAPVTFDTMKRALELGRYWLATAAIILSMGDEITEQARAIKAWIDRNRVTEFKVRDLQRNVQRKTIGLDQAVDYVPALELLIELGWVTPSESDWAEKVGQKRTSSGNFAVWSPPPLRVTYVGNVGCRSMGERESLPPPSDTPRADPIPTPDITDTPVDKPIPDYSHIDF
jgi:replicative DNA helicase